MNDVAPSLLADCGATVPGDQGEDEQECVATGAFPTSGRPEGSVRAADDAHSGHAVGAHSASATKDAVEAAFAGGEELRAKSSTTMAAMRPKRLVVPLNAEEDLALKRYRLEDGLPSAARIRAMLQVYRENKLFRRQVDKMAQQMR